METARPWSTASYASGMSSSSTTAIAGRRHCRRWVPQIGAVLVPINYRLTAEDFVYITGHSGAKVLCVHPDYVAAVDGVRSQLGGVEHFVVLGKAGGAGGWREYDAEIAKAKPAFERPEIAEGDCSRSTTPAAPPPSPKA
jgi:fatty-acyl-CoA synthase